MDKHSTEVAHSGNCENIVSMCFANTRFLAYLLQGLFADDPLLKPNKTIGLFD
jgi:hypothetical protein